MSAMTLIAYAFTKTEMRRTLQGALATDPVLHDRPIGRPRPPHARRRRAAASG